MIRILTLLGALAAMAGPALALEDFSQARCEDESLKDYIGKTVPEMVSLRGGQRLSDVVQVADVARSTTVSATRNQIVCRVKIGFRYAGYFDYISGTFTLEQAADGSQSARFKPL